VEIKAETPAKLAPGTSAMEKGCAAQESQRRLSQNRTKGDDADLTPVCFPDQAGDLRCLCNFYSLSDNGTAYSTVCTCSSVRILY
jgi:hypothetical protein